MPDLIIPKAVIEGRPSIPGGIYKLRLDGFHPSKSKKGDSINLQPVLKSLDMKDEDGKERQFFFNMNTNFGTGLVDICHGLGVDLTKGADGQYRIPGKWDGPDNDPSKWQYSGPLLGEIVEAEIVEVPKRGPDGNAIPPAPGEPQKMQNDIKAFICRVAGCTQKHSTDLIGSK